VIELYPFQEIGRDFLALRNNAILADDMGLGKTYQALEAIKKLNLYSGLIICTQSTRHTWAKRVREQMPEAFVKEITSPKILPDVNAFNVVNYDIVWKKPLIDKLKEIIFPVMVCDESHALKSMDAKRTKFILGKKGLYLNCKRRWLMTGTPVLNRPIELYPALRSLFPTFLGRYTGYYDFAFKFCGGHQAPFGFDATGASNLEQLCAILKPIMLRRLKEDVLEDLPEVTYEKIYLEATDKLMALTEKENKLYRDNEALGENASIRRTLGVIKATAAIKHLKNLLEEREKVVVFIWHTDVARAIVEAFPNESVLYTGKESAKEKEEALTKFRKDPKTRLFVGQLISAGIGVDGLQYVSDVCVFVEMSYVPGEIRQAVDRLNRIGQDKPVLAQFLVAEDSLDEKLINTLIVKAKNINTIMGEKGVTEFIGTKCGICGRTVELKQLKRALTLTVCKQCKKEMECIL